MKDIVELHLFQHFQSAGENYCEEGLNPRDKGVYTDAETKIEAAEKRIHELESKVKFLELRIQYLQKLKALV